MPSQIYDGSIVAANYLKAKPTTRISTRQLAFFEVAFSGAETDYKLPNSLYLLSVISLK